MENDFIILYVMTIGILIYDSVTLGIIKAQLDNLEKNIKNKEQTND